MKQTYYESRPTLAWKNASTPCLGRPRCLWIRLALKWIKSQPFCNQRSMLEFMREENDGWVPSSRILLLRYFLLTPMWRKTTRKPWVWIIFATVKKVYTNSRIHSSTSLGSRSRWDALAEKAPTRLGDRGDQVPCFIDSQLNQEQLSEFKALFLEKNSIYQFPKRPQFFLKALSSVFWLVDGFGKSPVAPVGCLITNISMVGLARRRDPPHRAQVGSGFVGQDGWKY